MGLFNFFKKKTIVNEHSIFQPDQVPFNKNIYLAEVFKSRLIEMGYEVEWHAQYLAFIVSGQLEIATSVIDNPENHPNLMQLMVLASHPTYFPSGIIETVVGAGTSIETQVNSALDNYIGTTFLTIIESFSESHNPDLDFMIAVDGKEILWHPKLGKLHFQGQWQNYPENERFYELVKNIIPAKLTLNKINWLKLYISKRADGTLIGDCLFNNDDWAEGLTKISEYAESWKMDVEFKGLKQFIMLGVVISMTIFEATEEVPGR